MIDFGKKINFLEWIVLKEISEYMKVPFLYYLLLIPAIQRVFLF